VTERNRVTFDVNVYVSAVQGNDERSARDLLLELPSAGTNIETTALAIIGDAGDHTPRAWSLFISEHVLSNIVIALKRGYGWDDEDVSDYLDLILDLCERSEGGLVEPTVRVTDCPDYEDNRILELALASDSHVIVSNDWDLVSMNPWKGRAVMMARDYVSRAHPRNR
jgi:predicted nucleic acid-binding protein